MVQGATPTHTFSLPFDVGWLQKVRITYAQNGKTVLEKTEADCVLEGNTIKVELTQEETLKFEPKYYAKIQLKVLTLDNKTLIATNIEKVRVEEALCKELLSYG